MGKGKKSGEGPNIKLRMAGKTVKDDGGVVRTWRMEDYSGAPFDH
jgi:hypothetical protein